MKPFGSCNVQLMQKVDVCHLDIFSHRAHFSYDMKHSKVQDE